jgi:drug/metabolite transporter (DMT)-like permease
VESNLKKTGFLYCFAAVFFFSTNELVGKFIGEGISPAMITIVRFLIGFVILLPFALRQKRKELLSLQWSDFLNISIPAVINVVGAMLFLQLAIYYGKASTSAILISSNPIFVVFLAALILKEKISGCKLIGMFLGLAGILLVIRGEIPSLTAGTESRIGLFFGILASFTFALFTVLAKREVKRYGNLLFNAVSFLTGAVALLLVASLFNIDLHFTLSGRNIILILYLGVFVTVAAYILYFAGLKEIPAATGSMLFFLKPFIASALSWIFLGERISFLQFLGIFLILGGIRLSQKQEA